MSNHPFPSFPDGFRQCAILLAGLFILLFPMGAIAHNDIQNLQPIQITSNEQAVMFNTESHKFHGRDCRWALKCTVNCIAVSRTEAIRRGGVPCKVCGGR